MRRYRSATPSPLKSFPISHESLLDGLEDGESLDWHTDYMMNDEPVDINGLVHGSLLNDKYITMGVVGKGHYSIVTEALDFINDEKVAIKIGFSIPAPESPTLVTFGDTRLQVFDSAAQLETELSVYQQLSGSCNTLSLLDSFKLHNATFLVFPVVPMSLMDYMYQHRPADLSINTVKITQIAVQPLQALQCLHAKKLVHNDLKPENVMIDPETMHLSVIGFTQACLDNCADWPIGTAAYESPEVTLRGRGSSASDMWSFALLLAEMMYGYPVMPFLEPKDHMFAIRELLGMEALPSEAELYNSIFRSFAFQASTRQKLDRLMLTRDRHFTGTTFMAEYKWSKMKHIRNVILGCLRFDPDERLTAEQALDYLNGNINLSQN